MWRSIKNKCVSLQPKRLGSTYLYNIYSGVAGKTASFHISETFPFTMRFQMENVLAMAMVGQW